MSLGKCKEMKIQNESIFSRAEPVAELPNVEQPSLLSLSANKVNNCTCQKRLEPGFLPPLDCV